MTYLVIKKICNEKYIYQLFYFSIGIAARSSAGISFRSVPY